MNKVHLKELIEKEDTNLELYPEILKFPVVYDLVSEVDNKRVDYVVRNLFKNYMQSFIANNELFFEGGWALSAYINVCSVESFRELSAEVMQITKKASASTNNLLSIFSQFYISKAGQVSKNEYVDIKEDFLVFIKKYKKTQPIFNPLQLNMSLASLSDMSFQLNDIQAFEQQIEFLKIVIGQEKNIKLDNTLISSSKITHALKNCLSNLIYKKTLKEQQLYLDVFNKYFQTPGQACETVREHRIKTIVECINNINAAHVSGQQYASDSVTRKNNTKAAARHDIKNIIIQLLALNFNITGLPADKKQELFKIVENNSYYINEINQIYKSRPAAYKAFVKLLFMVQDSTNLQKKYSKEIAALQLNISKRDDFSKFFILVFQDDYFKQHSLSQYYKYIRQGAQNQREKVEKQLLEKNLISKPSSRINKI